MDYILYSLPQLKNIFEKVFTSDNKFEVFNDYDYLIEMLDEIFDEFKYETLRFILEWKNSNGNIMEIMRIREIKALRPLKIDRKRDSLANSLIIIDKPGDFIEEDEEKISIFIKEQTNYQRKSPETEKIEERIRIIASGFPYPLNKGYSLDEAYYKLARKSVKSLTQISKKLFSIDLPNVNNEKL